MTIDRLVSGFAEATNTIPAPILRYPIEDLRTTSVWPHWASDPGVYFFERAGCIEYVGRALRTTLQQRLANQCFAYGDPRWDQVLRDPSTVVGVVPVQPAVWYLAAALEAYLIHALRPTHSRRIS